MPILVTGGTKGIGLAIARRLATKGETLFLVYNADSDAADLARAEIEEKGATAHTIQADVGSIEGVESIISEIREKSDGLTHIIHSAAMVYPTTMLDADLGKFRRAIETNGLSLLYLVQKALPLLARGSSIVFISSTGARVVLTGSRYAALGPAKALAEAIILYLVPELAPLGIRINAVAPGLVLTPSVATMTGSEEAAKQVVEAAAARNPSGRASEDSDYASLVEYLLSPEAEFVQGQVIAATGGVNIFR